MSSTHWTGAVALATLAALAACASSRKSMDELLENPSLHIMVSDDALGPSPATFDFETKLYRLADPAAYDLAAVDARVAAALEGALVPRGFRRETEEPDLLLSYAIAVDSAISGEDLNAAYADEFQVAFPEAQPDERLNYHQGTLIVDFVDRASRRLLWRGAIMANVDVDVTDADRDRRARYVAEILLRHYPQPVQAESAE
jgi:hypothetical protein